jgi:hypothetical protein
MFCPNCGNEVSENAVICVKCKAALKVESPVSDAEDSLSVLFVCIFLAYLDIHRFYTKKKGISVIQLLMLESCVIRTFIDFIMMPADDYKDGSV